MLVPSKMNIFKLKFVIVSIIAPVKISMMPSAPPQVSNDLTAVHRPKISFSIDSIVSSKKDGGGSAKSVNDSEQQSKLSPRSQYLQAIRGGSPPSTVPFSIRHHLFQNKNGKIENVCEVNSTNGDVGRGSPEARSSPVSRSPSPGASDGGDNDNRKSATTPTQISPTSVVPRGPPGFLSGILGQSPTSPIPPQHPPGLSHQIGAFPPPPHPGVLNFAAAAAAAAAAGHHPQLPIWGQPPHHPSHHPVAHPLYPWLLARQARLFPHHRFGPGPDLPGFLFQPFRKPKRIRTAFSPTQLLRLEHAFEKNHYVVGTERKQLAKALGLSETQVKVWFQNRRTKHKRTEQEEHCEKKTVSVGGAGGSRSDLHGSSADSSTKNFTEDMSDDEELVMDDEDEYSHSDEEHEMLQNNVHHNNNHSSHMHLHNPHLPHHHSDFHKT